MNETLTIMTILILGLMFGRISFFGIRFGSAGVLLVALVFGHFEFTVNPIITEIGLLFFVTGVGLSAGPVFVQNFKNKAVSYIVISFITILTGALLTIGMIYLMDLPPPLSLGVMTGALTSTPGLGAAVEATQSNLASVGYGVAYVFGVVGVILFVQLSIRFLKVNPKEKAEEFVKTLSIEDSEVAEKNYNFKFDKNNLTAFFLTVLLGIIIGRIAIPIPGGAEISLGNAGGALITGLLFGYLGGVGPISLKVNPEKSDLLSDFGLTLFYVGTGLNAGAGALSVLTEYGAVLFFSGVFITIICSLVAFLVGYFGYKLQVIDTLGAVTGAMTATPGLGTLVDLTGVPEVAASYASTYPVALLFVVLFVQVLSVL